jgi:hypothetical protein
MPTGYTSEIYEGKEVTGKKFLMDCARVFGACIMMRDEPADAEIPESFQLSTYHKEQIDKAKDELKRFQSMSIEEIQNTIDKEYEETLRYNKEKIKEYVERRNRYLNTLADVISWTPPTKNHKELKEFAIQQLKDSMNFDCNISYYEEEVVKQTPEEWLKTKIDKCLKDIDYHAKENQEEIERTDDRNKWIKELRDSLVNL